MSSLCLNVPVCHHYTLASVLLQGSHKENVNTAQWPVNMSHTKRKRIYVRLRIAIHVYKHGALPLDHVHGLLLPDGVSLCPSAFVGQWLQCGDRDTCVTRIFLVEIE